MQNEQTYEESSVSLWTILKVGFGRKWLFFTVAIVIALASFFGVHYGYTAKKVTYTASYNFDIKAIQDNKYIDGTSFILSSIVSAENLNAIKASNEEFAGIDVDKIIEDNAITINGEKKDEKATSDLTLSIPKKYCKNVNTAKDFLKAIADTPVTKTNSLADTIAYNNYLSVYDVASTYENKISALESQLQFLNDSYDSLIEIYGDQIIVIEGDVKIVPYYFKSELNATVDAKALASLYAQIREKGYVYHYNEAIADLQLQKTNVETQIALTQSKITAVEKQRSDLIDEVKTAGISVQVLDLNIYNETLNELYIEKTDLENELALVNKKITDGATADTTEFDKTLTSYFTKLTDLTATYKMVASSVIKNNNNVYLATSSGIESKGGLHIVIEILLAIILGCLVGICVNLVIDREKLKPAKVEVQQVEEKKE